MHACMVACWRRPYSASTDSYCISITPAFKPHSYVCQSEIELSINIFILHNCHTVASVANGKGQAFAEMTCLKSDSKHRQRFCYRK